MSRRTWLGSVVVMAVLPASVVLTAAPAAATHTDLLPDLRMARLTDFSIQQTSDGRRLLRFSSRIVNTGKGRFEARGSRADTGVRTMPTKQRIYNTSGGYRTVTTPAVMYYSGDGHNHWHVRDLEDFKLRSLDGRSGVGTGAKHGFCFYDNVAFRLNLPGAPQSPYYRSCGTSTSLKVRMGLSVGWGDLYSWRLPDQYVEITDLPDGRYRLTGVADKARWFRESNPTNNTTWTDLRISGGSVTVLQQGPAA